MLEAEMVITYRIPTLADIKKVINHAELRVHI